MRRVMLALAVGLAWPAAIASAQTDPGPKPAARSRPTAAEAPATSGAVNADARRLEEERHRRWDERMRRATRSLCDRC